MVCASESKRVIIDKEVCRICSRIQIMILTLTLKINKKEKALLEDNSVWC